MPYYKCRKCQHEFEESDEPDLTCDWCGADKPIVLEEQTPLEKLCSDPDTIIDILQTMRDNVKFKI